MVCATPNVSSGVLTHLFAHLIEYVELEIASMSACLTELDAHTREQFATAHGEDSAWKGFASTEFLALADSLGNVMNALKEEG